MENNIHAHEKYSSAWYESQTVESLSQEIADRQKEISGIAFSALSFEDNLESNKSYVLGTILPKMVRIDMKEEDYTKLVAALSKSNLLPSENALRKLILSSAETQPKLAVHLLEKYPNEDLKPQLMRDLFAVGIRCGQVDLLKFLSSKGIPTNRLLNENDPESHPLDMACKFKSQNIEVIKFLLKNNPLRESSILIAARTRNPEILTVLLEHSNNLSNSTWKQAINKSISDESPAIVTVLFKYCPQLDDMEIHNFEQLFALDEPQLVETLLQHGHQLPVSKGGSESILSLAQSFKMLQYLLTKGTSAKDLTQRDVENLMDNFVNKNDLAGVDWLINQKQVVSKEQLLEGARVALLQGKGELLDKLLPAVKNDFVERYDTQKILKNSDRALESTIPILMKHGALDFEWIKENADTLLQRAFQEESITLFKLVLAAGVSPDHKVNDINLIEDVICLGKIDFLRALIAQKVNVNVPLELRGSTPLKLAMLYGGSEIAELLLDAGADPNDGALIDAIQRGELESVRSLIRHGADVNKIYNHEVPLHSAMRMNISAARLLLEAGARIDIEDSEGNTPFDLSKDQDFISVLTNVKDPPLIYQIKAAIILDNEHQIKQLVKDPEILKTRSGGRSLIRIAVENGSSKALIAMHALGIDLKAEDENGSSAVTYAMRFRRMDILKTMAALGVVDFKDPKLMKDAVEPAYKWDQLEFLLMNGGSFKPADFPGRLPIHDAISKDRHSLIPLLVAQGWKVNATDDTGMNPLAYAASVETSEEVFTALIKAGSEVNTLDFNGFAPIHYAAANNLPGNIIALKKLGAKLSILSEAGMTALHFAIQEKASQAVSVLTQLGADFTDRGAVGVSAAGMAFDTDQPLFEELLIKALKPLESSFGSQIMDAYLTEREHFITRIDEFFQSATSEWNNFLPLAFILEYTELAQKIAAKMSPEDFDKACDEVQKMFPTVSVDITRYCMYKVNPDHIKVGAAEAGQAEAAEELIDVAQLVPSYVELCRQGPSNQALEEKLSQLIGLAVEKKLPSGIDKIAPEDMNDAIKAYHEHVDPVRILFNSQRLIKLLESNSDKEKYLQALCEQDTSAGLHRVYMNIVKDFIVNEFNKINFSQSSEPGYRNPANILLEGNVVPVNKLKEYLIRLVEYTGDRTPYTGTPPEGTAKLDEFYAKIEKKLDQYVRELVPHADVDQKATIQIDLAKEASYCASKWVQNIGQQISTLKGELKIVDFEDKYYNALQNFRSGIIQEMVPDRNVHKYNHFVSEVGEELNLPDAETLKGVEDLFASSFLQKEEIRQIFYALMTNPRLISFTANFLKDTYKDSATKDQVIGWFIEHIPKNWRAEHYGSKMN